MIVASRYAKSLLDLATEKGQLEAVYADMQQLKSVCAESKDFVLFLKSPIIESDKKVSTLKTIFEGKVNAISLSFIAMAASKRREATIPAMVTSFIEQYKTQKNIITAVVTSANGLDEATREKALHLIKTQLNGEVELIEKTNKDLIGGFVLKVGDKQLDKSVARQLANLKKQLTN